MTDRIGDESVGEIACRGRVYTGPGGLIAPVSAKW